MTTSVELINDPNSADLEPDLDMLDRSAAVEDDPSQAINDRRAQFESPETLRLARAL